MSLRGIVHNRRAFAIDLPGVGHPRHTQMLTTIAMAKEHGSVLAKPQDT